MSNEKPATPLIDDEAETYLTKIDWAHQRELTMAAMLLATGIGAFEVLDKIQNWWALIFLYGLLLVAVVLGIFYTFKFELTILQNQLILKLDKHWEFTFGIVLKTFFIIDGREIRFNKITLGILIFFVVAVLCGIFYVVKFT